MTITHSRLAHALMYLRPDAVPGVDYTVEDTGSGPTLRDGMANPPSQADVDALTEAQLDRAKSRARLFRMARDAADIAALRATFARMVDDDAEACRLRYITPGAGMAMTYQEKFAQAQAVAAMGEAAANALSQVDREEQFPTLSASVGLEAPTLWECAQRVLAAYAAFAQLSLVIERTRLSGKSSISAASDGAAVIAAYEALTWPTP